MFVNPINNASTSTSLVHPGFNNFFKWTNGKLKPKDENNPTLFEKTNGLVLKTTKTVWPLYLPLQIIGLFSKRAAKLAKAFYGVCWSIVYTCLRPFAPDRKTLGGTNATPAMKEAYNLNEHFRLGMGTVVSALYGGGAFAMLWGALTGNDKFFDKAAKVYSTGMLNQNQIFGSMNLEKLLSRKFNNSSDQLPAKVDQEQTGVKEKMEFLDAVLFIPNVITRGLDTARLFGAEFNEGVQRCINALGKISYGNWACRFSELKKKKSKEEDGSEYGGDLEPLDPSLKGKAAIFDKALRDTQEKSAKVFQFVIPGLSWLSSGLELLGFHELSEKVFKLSGTLERLLPTIAAWCIRNPILNLFKKPNNNQKEIRKQSKQENVVPVAEPEQEIILSFEAYNRKNNDACLDLIRKGGKKVRVNNFDAKPESVATLAGKYSIQPQRLANSINYETIFVNHWLGDRLMKSEEENFPLVVDDKKMEGTIDTTAAETNIPAWVILRALKREQYQLTQDSPCDYASLKEYYSQRKAV